MMHTIARESSSEVRPSRDIDSSFPGSSQPERPVKQQYVVIHPLDDAPEAKLVVTSEMGHIKLTRSVKASLFVLRAYLIIMLVLVAYRVITMAQ